MRYQTKIEHVVFVALIYLISGCSGAVYDHSFSISSDLKDRLDPSVGMKVVEGGETIGQVQAIEFGEPHVIITIGTNNPEYRENVWKSYDCEIDRAGCLVISEVST